MSVVPLVGVPFVNSARVTKTISLLHKSGTKLIVEIETKTHDVPYGDSFLNKEVFIVFSAHADEPRAIFIMKIIVTFPKYTIFKSKIDAGGCKGLRETHSIWLKHVKKHGYLKKKELVK